MSLARTAVATRCLHPEFKTALQTARQLAVDGIQIDGRNELRPADLSATGRKQLLHQLEELALSVGSLYFPTRRSYFDQDQLEARVEATKSAMQFAYNLRSRVLTARVGRLPDDPDSEDSHILVDVLEDLARHGNHIGVTFSIIPSREPPESLLRLCEAITQGPIGISFDPASWVMAGQDPVIALRLLHPFVTHYQIRDAVRDADGGGLEVPVGRGEVDWDEFLPLIDETGYRGWLTVDRTAGDDKAADADRAVQFLKNVMRNY